MTRVLLTDGDSAAALAAARSLGRHGLRVEVAESHDRPRAARSRYCATHHVCPDPGRETAAFQAWACAFDADLVMPTTDVSLVPLLDVRDQLRGVLAAPSTEAVRVTLSKRATAEHAVAHGVPTPVTRSCSSALARRLDPRDLPIYVKPDASKVWTAHGAEHLSVGRAETRAELEDMVSRLERFGPVVVQAPVPGDIVAVSALSDRGDLRFAFQYRRLHQVPPSGGASSYRVSEPVDPALARHVAAFLAPLEWTGVAMFEFKVDGDRAWLIEVNGRLWGSLALPVACGADFPAWLADLTLHGRRDFPGYRTGVRCRALTKEVAWLKAVVRGAPGSPPLGALAADSARAFDPRERWDGFAPDDPAPAIAEAVDVAQAVAGGVTRAVRRRLVRAQMAARRRLRPWRDARRVLFVCEGNYIRSVYGAALLEAARPELTVTSAGLVARPGRPPHPRTVERAAARGLDVADHAAAPLDDAMLRGADAVFVMTLDQVFAIRRRFGDHAGLCLLDSVDIVDPDGASAPTFARVFDQLDSAMSFILED